MVWMFWMFWLCAATGLAASDDGLDRRGAASLEDARQSLARVRTAIGGGPVQSVVVRGLRRAGFNGVTGKPLDEFRPYELRYLEPGHFVQVTRTASGVPMYSGFAGDRPIFGRQRSLIGGVEHVDPGEGFLERQRPLAAQLLLLLFCHLEGPVEVQVVDQSQPGLIGFKVASEPEPWTLVLDERSGRPVMLRMQQSVEMPIQPRPGAARRSGLPWQRSEEAVTWELSDWKLIGSRWIPHRLLRRTDTNIRLEEIQVEAVDIGARLTPADFGGG